MAAIPAWASPPPVSCAASAKRAWRSRSQEHAITRHPAIKHNTMSLLRIGTPSTRQLRQSRIPQATLRLAQPCSHHGETDNQKGDAGRNPHDQPAKLLIRDGVESPRGSTSGIDGIPELLRECNERSEDAAV